MLDQETLTALTDLRGRLERERRRIAGEIGGYPRPIAGCDVQFNHLLEQRTKVARALSAVNALTSGSPDGVRVQAAEAILAMPALVSADLTRALRRALEEAGG